jgi:FixJ family two-component response regulator
MYAPGTLSRQPIVIVVDDDLGVRNALAGAFDSIGLSSKTFGTADELFAFGKIDQPGCLVLDVRLPGLGGLELQARLAEMGNQMPIVFITGFGDIPMSVRALKAGAVDFLTKPFRDQDVLEAVSVAIAKDVERRGGESRSLRLKHLAKTLTPRELEVMNAVVKGAPNKQIAYALGIAETTVKLHRGNVMRKMEASSLVELVDKAWKIASLA